MNTTTSRSRFRSRRCGGAIDHLAALGISIITQSGGEPLLHPQLDQIISRVRHHGILAGMITNGYLLTADRIRQLNRAGLDHLQISIDNVLPDEISKKSLKVLDQKLVLLAEHAEFQVNINSVLGSGVKNPGRRAGRGAARARAGLHQHRRRAARRQRPTRSRSNRANRRFSSR